MKKLILALSLLFVLGMAPRAHAQTLSYSSAATVKQMWIQDYQGVKFAYFSVDNSVFFGFPLNHPCAEHWLSILELAMKNDHKAIQVGWDPAATAIDTKTKAGVRPIAHLGIWLDGGP